jgi:crotonobetaine/carnitine-CoA ligase
MPHAHCYLYGLGTIDALQLTRADRYYIVLPLFHANGLLMQLGAALIAGIPAVVRARFSAGASVAAIVFASSPTGKIRPPPPALV